MSLEELFEKHNGAKFEDIENKQSDCRDFCAFLVLHGLLPETKATIVSANYSEIFLGFDLDELRKVATEDDVILLAACGVRIDRSRNCLSKFY